MEIVRLGVPPLRLQGQVSRMELMKLEELSNETLIELTKMYARNWQTLDSLWFRNVEQEYGLDTAVLLDLKNWERQSVIEAERIKEVLRLDNGGLPSVLTAISFMSWQLVSPPFRCEEESPQRVVFSYPRCPVQEGRMRQGKPEFPCKDMKLTLFSLVSRVIEPRAVVTCLACPPGHHPGEFWCRWEINLIEGSAEPRNGAGG